VRLSKGENTKKKKKKNPQQPKVGGKKTEKKKNHAPVWSNQKDKIITALGKRKRRGYRTHALNRETSHWTPLDKPGKKKKGVKKKEKELIVGRKFQSGAVNWLK